LKSITQSSSKMRTGLIAYGFIAPFFIIYILFSFIPIVYSLYISFTDWNGIGASNFVGFKNYIYLFTEDRFFWKSVGNTFIIMLSCVPLLVIGGILLATLLYSKFVKGKRLFQCLNFLPYLTTPVAIGLIFAMLFEGQTGLVNRVIESLGMINPIDWLGIPWSARVIVIIMVVWKYIGYNMVFFLSGLSGISNDVYEAAEIDGASSVTTFFRITIPLLKNIVVFVILTSIIGGLQLMDEPMLLLSGWANPSAQVGGPDRSCLTSVWYLYDTAFGTNMRQGIGAAISYSLFIIIAIFSFISYKISNRGGDNT
jgi:cellobiose transport system permease protein